MESRVFAAFVNHPMMSNTRSLLSFMSQKEQQCVNLLLGNLREGLETVKGTHS